MPRNLTKFFVDTADLICFFFHLDRSFFNALFQSDYICLCIRPICVNDFRQPGNAIYICIASFLHVSYSLFIGEEKLLEILHLLMQLRYSV